MNKETTKYNKSVNGGDSVKTEDNIITKAINKKVSRRTFIKTAAVAGGVAAATGAINFATAASYGETAADSVSGAGVAYKRSGCWGCAGGCGTQIRVVDGVATKIDGNPYDPVVSDLTPAGAEVTHTDVAEPIKNPGKLCPKGQAMLKELYDPYRVLTPLKRVGARGSGRWQAISWGTAIEEIVNGGELPGPNASNYTFEGLKQIKGDGTAMGDTHADIHASLQGNAVVGGGGKGQRIIWTDGRNQQGTQARFLDRLGSSRYDHSSVCNGNWKAAWGKSLGAYIHRPDYQTDLATDYVIYSGVNPLEADQFLNYTGRKLTDLLAGGTKVIVLDPRLSVTASKANSWGNGSQWVRIKQGGDGAFALGIIKHWFASGTQITSANAHLKATRTTATKLNHTNAAYLVEVPTGSYPYGKISANVIDPGNGTVAGSSVDEADLNPGGVSGGNATQYDSDVYSGTVYQLLKARVESLDWADIHTATGIGANAAATQTAIEAIADGFWSASRPVAMPYRGATQHSSGYYTAQAWVLLNILRDRVDRPGGLVLQEDFFKADGSVSNPGANPTGRTVKYDRSQAVPTGLAGTPERPWFPGAYSGAQQEIIPGEAIGYPWRIRAHIFYAHNPAYTHHAGANDVTAAMKKAEGNGYYVPLYVNITTSMNETAELCDYVLPGSTWAERWTTPTNSYGGPLVKRGTIRRPVVGSYVPVTVRETGGTDARDTFWYKGAFSNVAAGTYDGTIALANAISGPQTMEDILILVGRRLRELGDANMVNYGLDGRGAAGAHYDSSYDHYAAALKGSGILGATANEPGTTETLKQALDAIDADTSITAGTAATALDFAGKPWRKYLWMGGRRQNANPAFDSGSGFNANLYADATKAYLKNRHAQTLKNVWIAYYEGKRRNYIDAGYIDQLPPIDTSKTVVSVDGTDVNAADVSDGYTLSLSCNKLATHCQSRTSQNEWLRELEPTNYITVAASDFPALANGALVKVEANYLGADGNKVSVTGRILKSDTLVPGTVHIPHAYGRWAAGAASFKIGTANSTNGLTTAATYNDDGSFKGGTRAASFDGQLDLASGTAQGPVGRRDPYYEGKGGGGMTDIGGGHVMYTSKVKITAI